MAPAAPLTREQVASAQHEGDFAIKPEKIQPKLDTSQWPLLLKNYDKLIVRSSHFTPIPTGCSPLKRDIVSYIKYVPGRRRYIYHWHFSSHSLDLALSTWTSLRIHHHTKWWLGYDEYSVLKRLDTVEH